MWKRYDSRLQHYEHHIPLYCTYLRHEPRQSIFSDRFPLAIYTFIIVYLQSEGVPDYRESLLICCLHLANYIFQYASYSHPAQVD
jgi:hypothetical protein